MAGLWSKVMPKISREDWLALLLCIILMLLVVFTASIAPVWIYQNF
jgi:hypothetical protein